MTFGKHQFNIIDINAVRSLMNKYQKKNYLISLFNFFIDTSEKYYSIFYRRKYIFEYSETIALFYIIPDYIYL